MLVIRTAPPQLKQLQNLHRKKINNWPITSFIHNGSEIRIYMDSSGNMILQHKPLYKPI